METHYYYISPTKVKCEYCDNEYSPHYIKKHIHHMHELSEAERALKNKEQNLKRIEKRNSNKKICEVCSLDICCDNIKQHEAFSIQHLANMSLPLDSNIKYRRYTDLGMKFSDIINENSPSERLIVLTELTTMTPIPTVLQRHHLLRN